MRSLILWIFACGLVVLCSADLADRAHRHDSRNGRIALGSR